MTENREVKSDVFSMLMEDKANALQVYNGLNGSAYDNPELVEIKILKKGIALSIKNDASFIVDMNLNIYEHQSTYNPNMTLRLLIYLVEIIKPIIRDKDLFGRRRIMLPTPRFAVFYNGMEKRPAIEEFRLSDSFEHAIEKPELELVCKVYNINPGYNDDLLRDCRVLLEYTSFIEKVRQNQLSEAENPIENAIRYCIDNNILKDFLMHRGSEVINAMTIDMTFERREELIRRDVFEEGVEQGLLQGQEKLIYNALQKGKSPEEISEFVGVPIDLVTKVQDEMVNKTE